MNSANNKPNEAVNFLNVTSGFKSWAFSLDHKRIGIMYLVAILFMFFLGGVMAMLVRAELVTPDQLFLTANQYNQVFTLHGAIMVFLVIIPGIPAALGNITLPLLLGAKDVAFPKLNLLSFYLYLTGALWAVASILIHSVDTGWTFYTPYSIESQTAVSPILFGAFLMGFSSIFTGLNFIVTIHFMRPPGMHWFRMPLFLWSLYATGVIQILATPVLAITLLLLIAERMLGIGIFDPKLGGDPVLFQHFFWFYSHPAVYVMILPAMGVISETISTFSHKHIFGYKFIAFSSIAIAVLSFLVWGHHMFTSGQSQLMNMIFSALTYSVAIPSAVKVFNWLATMYRGAIVLRPPMHWTLSFILLFGIGGLTGLFLASLSTDIHLHETYFVVAHFHYTMMGSALIAFFVGLHYWWPKFTGRMYNEPMAIWACWIVFVGFNITFISQFIMGTRGMVRRYAHYLPQYQPYHVASTIGAFVLLIGFILIAVYLAQSLFRGKKAPPNPWGGSTLEWTIPSPPTTFNFEETPIAGEAYDHSRIEFINEEEGYRTIEPAKG